MPIKTNSTVTSDKVSTATVGDLRKILEAYEDEAPVEFPIYVYDKPYPVVYMPFVVEDVEPIPHYGGGVRIEIRMPEGVKVYDRRK